VSRVNSQIRPYTRCHYYTQRTKVESISVSPPTLSDHSAPFSPTGHTADNLASFFAGKVSDIRSATLAARPAMIVPRKMPSFSRFDTVATDEVMDLLTKAPSKTCQLDPIPMWLLKQLSDMLAPVIASLFHYSFEVDIFIRKVCIPLNTTSHLELAAKDSCGQ